jgi:hypothetical protein
VGFTHVAGIACHRPLGGAVGILEVLIEYLVGSSGHMPTRIQSRLGGPLSPVLGMGRGQNRGLNPMLQGALHLLRGSGAEDALQPVVHLAHPVSGGCQQCVQECSHRDHILTGLSKGRELPLHPFHRSDLARLKCRFVLVQVAQPGLDSYPLVGELASVPRGFLLDVVL